MNEKIFGFKIDFEKLQPLCSEEKTFETISFHPTATRDISGLVSEQIKIDDLIQNIKEVNPELIKSVDAFDVYQGENIPEKQKSISFHIVYQSDEKTLDTQTIDELQTQILKKLAQRFAWQIRN